MRKVDEEEIKLITKLRCSLNHDDYCRRVICLYDDVVNKCTAGVNRVPTARAYMWSCNKAFDVVDAMHQTIKRSLALNVPRYKFTVYRSRHISEHHIIITVKLQKQKNELKIAYINIYIY